MTLNGKGRRQLSVAFGPRMPGFGSWDWVGADTAAALADQFDVQVFDEAIPDSDVVVFIKFKPGARVLKQLKQRSRIVYCPIDFYGSGAEIDADSPSLTLCDRILIHCERLRRYFVPYSTVEYIDHHLKYTVPLRTEFRSEGPALWVGVRSNLPPLVEWVNQHPFDEELWVLTNPENPAAPLNARDYGLSDSSRIRIEVWTPDLHRDWTGLCRGAFDVKGEGFRASHKPPAKAIDFLVSGVPLMLEPDGSTAEHLRTIGFEVAALGDLGRWRSREYWEETIQVAARLCTLLDLRTVADRWSSIISAL